jgi:exonuclease VII small subunit
MPSVGQKESKKAELVQIDAEIQNSQKELEAVLSEYEKATSNEYELNTK